MSPPISLPVHDWRHNELDCKVWWGRGCVLVSLETSRKQRQVLVSIQVRRPFTAAPAIQHTPKATLQDSCYLSAAASWLASGRNDALINYTFWPHQENGGGEAWESDRAGLWKMFYEQCKHTLSVIRHPLCAVQCTKPHLTPPRARLCVVGSLTPSTRGSIYCVLTYAVPCPRMSILRPGSL